MSRKTVARYCLALAPILPAQVALAANTNPSPKTAISNYTRPLSFEPNQGQTDKQVDFLAHGAGYRLFLSHAEAVMMLDRGVSVRMRPVGGEPSSPEPLGEQPSRSNYFIGNDPQNWHTGIANYAKVRYRTIYPGVDLIYYGNQRQLEYDFVVNPGSDPNNILLQLQGGTQPTLDRSGDLVMHTGAGDLRWHKPVAYQEIGGDRKVVLCTYVRKELDRLGFNLGPYDKAKPVIIDPVLEYSTYFVESLAGLAVDRHGNAYVVGTTSSTDFPTTKDAFQKFYPGLPSSVSGNPFNTSVAFVAKFDTTGKLLYSTYLGGSGVCFLDNCGFLAGDTGLAIAADAHGDAYVTGSTYSCNFPVMNAYEPGCGGSTPGGTVNQNAFVTKLDPEGSALVYSTYLGGSTGNCGICSDQGNGIAVDSEGNAYVTGFTQHTDFPTKNAFQKSLNTMGFSNAFVTKFDAAGNELVYSTYLGGSTFNAFDQANGIAVDAEGHAYVIGTTTSPDFPTTRDAFQKNPESAAGNAFVTKFDRDGDSLIYSTYLGGVGGSNQGTGIAVDTHGNAYVTGTTSSPKFPTTQGAFQRNTPCPQDIVCENAFVTKFSPLGALLHSTFLGGSGGDHGNSIAVNRHGDAYVTGSTGSSDFPIKNAFQSSFPALKSGTHNAFVAKFDAAECALIYSSYLGGNGVSGGDMGNGIGVDAKDNAYVAGSAGSTNFPLSKTPFQTKPGAGFVTKISAK